MRTDAIKNLEEFGVGMRVDLSPLLAPFSVLTERYIDRFFSSQENLFQNPDERLDVKWDRYFHHVLVPYLLADDEVVRNILRAVYALPSKEPEEAIYSLKQRFTEMTLPETQPPWAPEAAVDY